MGGEGCGRRALDPHAIQLCRVGRADGGDAPSTPLLGGRGFGVDNIDDKMAMEAILRFVPSEMVCLLVEDGEADLGRDQDDACLPDACLL